MTWDNQFRIGNGERVMMSQAESVFRDYEKDCGIVLNEETFNEENEHYNIYFPSALLSDIVFTPKEQPKQTMTDYYFMTLDVKFPRGVN